MREVVAKVAPPKPRPEFERSTNARGKMMTRNVVVAPKEESGLKPILMP